MVLNVGRYRLLSVADTLIALLVTFPLTCMFWRGIWDLIGYYVLRGNKPTNHWVQTSVGLLQMVGLMLLPSINVFLDSSRKPILYWMLTRLFMYIHTLTYMFYWHGLWELLNYYLPLTWQWNVITLAMAWLSLAFLGGCRSTMWPPFFISVDTPEVFTCHSRFGSKPKAGNWLNYASDAFIAQLVVLGIAIMAWRSIFNIYDRLIFPDMKLKSDATCAIAGTIGCALFLSAQVPLGYVSRRLSQRPIFKVLWEDFVYLLIFVCLSLLWRGVWNLNAEYFIKRLPLGAWVNHALGTAGLMGMQTFTEVSAFGMLHDGTDEGGEAFYPLQYLRIFLKKWYNPDSIDQKEDVPATSQLSHVNEGFVGHTQDESNLQTDATLLHNPQRISYGINDSSPAIISSPVVTIQTSHSQLIYKF